MSDTQEKAKASPSPKAAIPWIGIAAVFVGLSISIFYGQLISVGLPDLRGAMHFSVDQASWLGATYNAAQMFIGPLSVYLGGLLGPRRVLLIACPFVALPSLLLPFVPHLPVTLFLLALVG